MYELSPTPNAKFVSSAGVYLLFQRISQPPGQANSINYYLNPLGLTPSPEYITFAHNFLDPLELYFSSEILLNFLSDMYIPLLFRKKIQVYVVQITWKYICKSKSWLLEHIFQNMLSRKSCHEFFAERRSVVEFLFSNYPRYPFIYRYIDSFFTFSKKF